MATNIPIMFLSVNGSCSKVYPNPRTRHVFRCPSTWYVTGDVFPITKKVLKFTETAIKHDNIMKPCIIIIKFTSTFYHPIMHTEIKSDSEYIEYKWKSTKTIGEYLREKTFFLVRYWSTNGPVTNRIAAWNGADWYSNWVDDTFNLFWIVFVSWNLIKNELHDPSFYI